jgi:polar amino acid transport system substrate-binding protein
MKRFQIAWTLGLVVVLVGFSINVLMAADDHLGVIKKRGKLIVGTSADYPPFESVDKNSKFVGFDMDLIREVGQRMGLKVEIKDMAFDGLIAATKTKKIDVVIACLTGTKERDKQIDFSTPYYFRKDAFLVSGKSDVKFKTPQDAAKMSIGVQTGSTQEIWVREHLIKPGLMKDSQMLLYERMDNAGLDLNAGRVDTLMLVAKPARTMAEKLNLNVALETAETVTAGTCIGMPDGETALKGELDRIINEIKADGWLDKKYKEFGLL